MWGNLIFVLHVYKFHPYHNLCILILSYCAHKFHTHHNLDILILSCCAHKSDFHCNLCIVIFVYRAHKYDLHNNSCIVICLLCLHLVFCLDFLQSTRHFMQHFVNWLFLFLKRSNNKKCLHFVYCFFSIFISYQAHGKYKWSLKIKLDNPMSVDEETIPMVHQNKDYDY